MFVYGRVSTLRSACLERSEGLMLTTTKNFGTRAADRETSRRYDDPGPSRTRLVRDLTPRGRGAYRGRGRGGGLVVAGTRPMGRTKPWSERAREGHREEMDDRLSRGERDEWRYRLKESKSSWEKVDNIYDEQTNWDADQKRPPRKDRDDFGTAVFLQQRFREREARRYESGRMSTHKPQEEEDTIETGFDFSSVPKLEDLTDLPTKFSSPPLMEGLLESVRDVLGRATQPSPIQALSLQHIVSAPTPSLSADVPYVKFLLASETGSGKSFAYMLPLLHHLKQAEIARLSQDSDSTPRSSLPINPRALILAPTHELARQLSMFAKSLVHHVKLRVLCASRTNVKSTARKVQVTASKLAEDADAASGMQELGADGAEEFIMRERKIPPVDVLVGTPAKLLEMVRGRGWDRTERERRAGTKEEDRNEEKSNTEPRECFLRKLGEKEMGLENVEWVVVDEADVLFDPDFQKYTLKLLADISEARGHPIAALPAPSSRASRDEPDERAYPFSLLLSTATIPSALADHLDTYHPSMTRLASPNLHRLPPKLRTEYVAWTGGNKYADVEQEIRKVWRKDVQLQMRELKMGKAGAGTGAGAGAEARPKEGGERPSIESLAKVLIFCNRSTRVEELGKYLTEKGIANVALTSTSDIRQRGNNKHLAGFLADHDAGPTFAPNVSPSSPSSSPSTAQSSSSPELTTSPPPPKPIEDALVVDSIEPGWGSVPASQPLQPLHTSNSPRSTSTSGMTMGVDPSLTPHVLITTSLLSRGLDFAPSTHVFITDPPRNMVDFLHRAGRSGRAGRRGRVVIFSKMKGRGSEASRDVRKKVGALR